MACCPWGLAFALAVLSALAAVLALATDQLPSDRAKPIPGPGQGGQADGGRERLSEPSLAQLSAIRAGSSRSEAVAPKVDLKGFVEAAVGVQFPPVGRAGSLVDIRKAACRAR